jgi:hypothetical protein
MPWCEPCERYYAPSAMTPEGHCPTCDNDLLAPDDIDADGAGDAETDHEKVPWHFKLMVVLLVAYLGWRFWELAAGLF